MIAGNSPVPTVVGSKRLNAPQTVQQSLIAETPFRSYPNRNAAHRRLGKNLEHNHPAALIADRTDLVGPLLLTSHRIAARDVDGSHHDAQPLSMVNGIPAALK